MQIRPQRLAACHVRVALDLLAVGRRKRAYRKLRQARAAVAGLSGRGFSLARRLVFLTLKNAKLHQEKPARRWGRRAVKVLGLLGR